MFRTQVDIFENSFRSYTNLPAIRWRIKSGKKPTYTELTYSHLEQRVDALGAYLISIGVKGGDHIGLIADVSPGWITGSIAIQMAGAVDVPRGTDSTNDEISYILSHSGVRVVFAANFTEVERIKNNLRKNKGKVNHYIVLDDSSPDKSSKKVEKLSEAIKKGSKMIQKRSKEYRELFKRRKNVKPESTSTIIYTSGTTGKPKGVQLLHRNLASQMVRLGTMLDIGREDRALTLLPPWHIFGRIAETIIIASGGCVCYTNIKELAEDMRLLKPTILPAVPRIWEGIYNKLIAKVKQGGKLGLFNFFKRMAVTNYLAKSRLTGKERLYKKRNVVMDLVLKVVSLIIFFVTLPLKLLGHLLIFRKVLALTGGNLRFSISGGGALSNYIDEFFAAIGIDILEGYGLTETAPVIAIRERNHIVLGTVGPLIPDTEARLIDYGGKDVTNVPGAKGTLHVRGPQVMKGYYKDPKKTKEVLGDDGWFNTGDLVIFTTNQNISIVGRSKDTIVLVGGENVEPTPIEEKLKESEYINHVMCIGQDKKSIGALIVPNEEELTDFAKANNIPGKNLADWIGNSEVERLYESEIQRLVSANTGFKPFERVTIFALLKKPFEKGDELSNTLKVFRHVVTERYQDIIDGLYR